jgi:hypothetical protein
VYSISVSITSGYAGIQLYHPYMADTNYASISFWLNGGASGGQSLQVYGMLSVGTNLNEAQSARYSLSTPQANTWTQYTVLLSSLGVANVTNFSGFVIQDSANKAEPVFYLDDIQLNSSAAPTLTQLTVNASQSIRTADARWFALNSTIWDSGFDTSQTIAFLTNMGTQALRFPGGSDSDDYHWLYNRQDADNWSWETSLASFIQVITNLNGVAMTTLNYGTGSSNEAAAWVAYVNASTTNTQSLGTDTNGFNWQTAGYWASLRAAAPLGSDDGKNFLRISRTAPLGFKYWEIGNEVYGASWETDSNTVPHDPYTYAVRSKGYISMIKAVDPTVKIGVVVETGEDSYVNNNNHLVTNPVTGKTHYGWTPVLLATLKSLGVTPDFAIYHNYPQNPGGESDAGLLSSTTDWAAAASDLRTQIDDYMGSNGTNIELVCTENNSVSSEPGKQSVSLVNGLYKVDSLAQLMQTEFNGLFWWALRNGGETDGNMSSTLYGWREYGDYGVVSNGYSNPYPTYYTTELMTHFVQTGDTVLTAASGYSLLPVYAVRRQNGSLTVLVINKDPVNTLNGQVSVASFTPASSGTVYSYGIPQDTAAENGSGSTNVAQTNISVAGTNISYAFPPYSATVLALSPAAGSLPVANAGTNQNLCSGGSGVAIGGSPTATGGYPPYTYSWSPATGLNNGALANPTASPASTTTYTVTVTDSTEATAQSSMTVTVNPAATANAGGNQTICAGSSTAGLGGSVGGGATGGSWTTSGSGSFAPNATTLNATYNPSTSDITAGTVTLTLTSSGQLSPCGPATAHVVVTINPAATASAGGNQSVCAGSSTAGLGGSVGGGATGGIWTTSGSGSFAPNATTLNATYNPSTGDITAGTVTLTLTSTGQLSPCGPATAHVVVTINPAATASSGGNQTICVGSSTAGLGGSVGGSATGGIWTTSGSGSFAPNATTLNAAYIPSTSDITAGAVTLTLTSTGQLSPCGPATAHVVVTVNPMPTITLGASPVLTYYGSTNASLPYTATSGSPDGYSITYDSAAQAAGFSNVALTSLPASPITLTVPIAAGTNTYNGTLTVNYSPAGCTSTNYAFAVTVTLLPVTLTGSRLYDGTAVADSSILTIVTNYDGTNLMLSGSATLAGAAAGLQNITNFSGLTLGGAAATNYTLTGASGSVTVNPLPLILTGTRAYDGTATATAGILSVVNAVGSDDVFLASGSAILAGTSVGPEAITSPGSLTLGGLTAGNYALAGVSGAVTVTNPYAPFLITSSSLDNTGTNFVVCWQSVPGVVYNVLTNTSLAPSQSWAVAGGPITATNTNTCFTLPGGILRNTNVNVVIQQ